MITKNRVAVAALTCVLGALTSSSANAQTIQLPDNTVEGFGAVRFENEYKLLVPQDQVAPLVAYLQKKYAQPAVLLPGTDVALRGTFSDEYFKDVYFDTPSQQLLRMGGGVRHRSRDIPGQPQNRKDDRQLMQIKLNIEGEDVTRSEVKYPIKHYPVAKNEEDRHPVLGIIDRDSRPDFSARMRTVGIDPWKLRESLTLEQRRRRMYLYDDVGPFATITVDETSSRKLWLNAQFTEVELELNEIRYTQMDEAGRDEMQRVTEAIKADIIAALPGIRQDQTPKYNKMYAALSASAVGGPMVMRLSVVDMRMLATVAGLVVFAAWILLMIVLRRRRQTVRPAPAPVTPRAREEVTARHSS